MYVKASRKARWIAAALALHAPLTMATPPASTRDTLNPGYSLLYQEVDNLPKLHWLLMFKQQSAPVKQLVDDTLSYYRSQSEDMSGLAEHTPSLKLHLNPMSDVEGRAREAIGKDRISAMKPIVGDSGARFEINLLLLLQNAIDEQRHLVGVLLEDEQDADLRKFLQASKTRLDALYARYAEQVDKRCLK